MEVDFASKTATCSVDPKTFDTDQAVKALTDEGFEPSSVETPDA